MAVRPTNLFLQEAGPVLKALFGFPKDRSLFLFDSVSTDLHFLVRNIEQQILESIAEWPWNFIHAGD